MGMNELKQRGNTKLIKRLCKLVTCILLIICSIISTLPAYAMDIEHINFINESKVNLINKDGSLDGTNAYVIAPDEGGHTCKYAYKVISDSTCTTKGKRIKYCSTVVNCSITKETTIWMPLDPNNHVRTYTTDVTPVCCPGGGKRQFCLECGAYISTEVLAHSWSNWREQYGATTYSEGLKVRSCTNKDCKEREYIIIPILGNGSASAETPTPMSPSEETSEKAAYNEPEEIKENKGNEYKQADPIDIFSGAHEIDFTIINEGSGQNLSIGLEYRSNKSVLGIFGRGFSWNYESHIEEDRGVISVYRTPSRYITYRLDENSNNIYRSVTNGNEKDLLQRNGDGSYTLTSAGKTYNYDRNGKLVAVINKNNQKILIEYYPNKINLVDAVTKHKLTLLLNSEGLVYKVMNAAGTSCAFFYYDNKKNLIKYTDVDGYDTLYTYDEKSQILSAVDADGNRYFEDQYDLAGHVVSQKDADGNISTFEHSETLLDGKKTVIFKNREGKKTYYEFDSFGRMLKSINELGATTEYEYDEKGNLVREIDALQNVKNYIYDSRSNLISYTDEDGNETKYVYDDNDNLVETIYPDGGRLSLSYDIYNRVVSSIDLRGLKTTYCYDSDGFLIEIVSGDKITLYTYEDGALKSITDPMGYNTIYTYDTNNHLISYKDKSGAVTLYNASSAGNILSSEDASGNIITTDYNYMGNPISVTNEMGNITSYKYDERQLLVETVDNKGISTKFFYDVEERLIKTVNSDDSCTFYDYDDAGNLIATYDAENNKTTYIIDLLGRITSEIDANGNRVVYTYTNTGKIKSKTDANNNRTSYTYDSVGRVKTITNPVGGITEYEYNYAGDVISVKDPLGHVISYNYNAYGNKISETDALGNKIYYEYDLNDNLIKKTDALLNVTYYEYDSSGRMLAERVAIHSNNVYDAERYNVIFDTNDGSCDIYYEKTVTYGTSYGLFPKVPKRDGYKFVGWFTDKEGGNELQQASSVSIRNNHTLYAHWDKLYSITYKLEGGKSDFDFATQYHTADEPIKLYELKPEKNDYVFVVWEEGGRGYSAGETILCAKNMTLTAHYERKIYNVRLMPNGATWSPINISYICGYSDGIILPSNRERDGYELIGWSIEEDSAVAQYKCGEKIIPSNSMILYAIWQISANNRSFSNGMVKSGIGKLNTSATNVTAKTNEYCTVTYNLNGGDSALAFSTQTVKKGERFEVSDIKPQKQYFAFMGWSILPLGGFVQCGNELEIVDDIELKAVWVPEIYTITYMPNGSGVFESWSEYYQYGRLLFTTPRYEDTNCKIVAWGEDPLDSSSLIMPNAKISAYRSMTLYAIWEKKNDVSKRVVTLDFNYENRKVKTLEMSYGDNYDNLPDGLIRPGYIFVGWFTKPRGGNRIDSTSKVIASGNHSIYAHWVKDSEDISNDIYDYEQTTLTKEEIGYITTLYEYDEMGRLIAVIDPEGNRTENEYDACGNVVKKVDALGNATLYQYDKNNNLVGMIDALGRQTSVVLNETGNIIQKRDALGLSTEYDYDKNGRIISSINPMGGVSSSVYDNIGNITSIVGPKGAITNMSYDSNGKLASISTVSDKMAYYTYNKLNLTETTTNARGGKTYYSYDVSGQIIRSQSDEDVVYYSYDYNGNLLTVTGNSGSISRTYDGNNRVLTSTDTKGRTIQYSYNSLGQLDRITYPDLTAVEYSYDLCGNIKTVTDWNGSVTTYEYDCLNRETGVTYANGRKMQKTYDAVGNITKIVEVNANGQIDNEINMSYDSENRLVIEEYSLKCYRYEYVYDDLGRIVSRITRSVVDQNELGIETFVYDAAGNIVNSTGKSLTYNGSDNSIEFCNDNICIIDDDGNLTSAFLGNEYAEFSYDAKNHLVATNNNRYAYDPEDYRVENSVYSMRKPSIPLGDFLSNCYNPPIDDNILEAEPTEEDMSSETINEESDVRLFEIGDYNNFESATAIIGNHDNEDLDDTSTDELSEEETCQSFDSELSEDIFVTEYCYDRENKNLIARYTSAGVEKYVYGNGLIASYVEGEGAKYKQYQYDIRGSVIGIFDDYGRIISEYCYSTYGERTTINGCTDELVGYCGRDGVLTDTNGLVYMRSRYYSVELMRFINQDIVLGNIGNSNSLNRYAYVEGNPASLVDPFGFCAEKSNNAGDGWKRTLLGVGTMIKGGIGLALEGTIVYSTEGLGLLLLAGSMSLSTAEFVFGMSEFSEGIQTIWNTYTKNGQKAVNPIRDIILDGNGNAYNTANLIVTAGGDIALIGAGASYGMLMYTTANVNPEFNPAITVGSTNEAGFEEWLNKGVADNKVYKAVSEAGIECYTGITKQPIGDRLAQHQTSKLCVSELIVITDELTRNQARALEQHYIESGINYLNRINSISPNHRYYSNALEWAAEYIESNGLPK